MPAGFGEIVAYFRRPVVQEWGQVQNAMNTMTPNESRRKALDIFSFILLSCPDFPLGTKTSISREFDELSELIETLLQGTSSEDGKQWLRICFQEIQQSRKHYEDGNRKEGRYMIQRAEEHFNDAYSKRNTSPRFLAGESGKACDNETGFPE